jgi:hypothetical protein
MMMKWIISFVDQGWCMCCINMRGDEIECASQNGTCKVFKESIQIGPLIGLLPVHPYMLDVVGWH